MRLLRPALLLMVVLMLLAACSSGPPVRIFPPQVSVQELRVLPDGRWSVDLRIRNYSTVPMRFSRLQATLEFGGQPAAQIDLDPGFSVGPGSSEVVAHVFAPPQAIKVAVEAAAAAGRGSRYRIHGAISSDEHGTDDDFEYQSALDPIPGLPGVLR